MTIVARQMIVENHYVKTVSSDRFSSVRISEREHVAFRTETLHANNTHTHHIIIPLQCYDPTQPDKIHKNEIEDSENR